MHIPVMPELLNIQKKLLPMVTEFNNYEYFYSEGGRAGGKSHAVGRFLLYLGEKKKLRIVCGREIQANIEESVFTLLVDYIDKFDLDYKIFKTRGRERLVHRRTGTVISFKGFREQGAVSIKGLEGVNILWIDEAQSITKNTLDVIIPTIIRNNPFRIFFTMNRFLRDDAVHEFCMSKGDNCLHIPIDYRDNEFVPQTVVAEAEECRARSVRDYNHIWLGQPIQQADNHLFNFDSLHRTFETQPSGGLYRKQRVLSIDFAAEGNDSCVATTLDRLSVTHWGLRERIVWDGDDPMHSIGLIIEMIGAKRPDITIIDYGGMGNIVYRRVAEVIGAMPDHKLLKFDGGSTEGIQRKEHANIRAAAFFRTKEWTDNSFLCISRKDNEVVRELEKIKFKYRSNGVRVIQSKQDMKKEMGFSPDNADSLNMAIWATQFLGSESNSEVGRNSNAKSVRRINKSKRHEKRKAKR